MARIGVLFATRHGHAGKIAERIAQHLRGEGHDVRLVRVPMFFAPEIDLAALDAVVMGGSMYVRQLPPELGRFMRRQRDALAARPTAFFSVSLAAASREASMRESVRSVVERWLASRHLAPRVTAAFGGELAYTRYPLPLRLVMRAIAWRSRGPTDTSRDHVLTDWDAVDGFARDVAALADEGGLREAA